MAINNGISDIWFNTDKDDCIVRALDGKFSHYDNDALANQARDFAQSLVVAGFAPQIIPTPDALVADFLDRL